MRTPIRFAVVCAFVLGAASLAKANSVFIIFYAPSTGTVKDGTGNVQTYDGSTVDTVIVTDGPMAAIMQGLTATSPAFYINVGTYANSGPGDVLLGYGGPTSNPNTAAEWSAGNTAFNCTTFYNGDDLPGSTLTSSLVLPNGTSLAGKFTSYSISVAAEGLDPVTETNPFGLGQTWEVVDNSSVYPTTFSATFDGTFVESANSGATYTVALSWGQPPTPQSLALASSVAAAAVPEPLTILGVLTGLASMGFYLRRRHSLSAC